MRSSVFRGTCVVVLFLILTALLTFPLSFAPASRALPLSADTRLFLWTISWDVHALLHQPLRIFDANIFFPERHTLAYSEHLLGSALLGAPFLLATGNPLLAINVVLLLSCVLSAAGTYLLARRLGIGREGALAAGVVFAFASPRFSRLAQLHMATLQWIPFCLASLHAYAKARSRRHLLAAAALFTLQAVTSGHGGLFLLLAGALLLAYLWAFGLLPPPGRAVRDLGLAGILVLALNALFLLPYWQVQREVGLHRTLGAVEEWTPNAVSFLAAPTYVQQALLSLIPALRQQVEGARAFLFPGWLTLVFAALALRRHRAPGTAVAPPIAARAPLWVRVLDSLVVASGLTTLAIHVAGGIDWTLGGLRLSARNAERSALVFAGLVLVRLAAARRAPFAFAPPLRWLAAALRRQLEARMGVQVGFYVVLTLLSLWASLGPRLGFYTVLYRLVPGFDLIRVPSRLTILTLLALAVLAGFGFDRAIEGTKRRAVFGALAVALLVTELAAFPLKAVPYAIEIPVVDRWLATQPGPFAIVELPVADPADAVASARLHSHYMLHSTAHWHPILNGYSGLTPPRHERLFRVLTAFPDTASLAELEALGIRYVVVHGDLYAGAQRERAESRLAAFADRLNLEVQEGDGRVYSLVLTRRNP